ncbi:hypothetical protein, partial [Acinetobacter baumannii]|uniref:hypothetical protein n=1 Tax=Acinetobacter baumannii TaxID=470 RepID=UPI001D0EF8FA
IKINSHVFWKKMDLQIKRKKEKKDAYCIYWWKLNFEPEHLLAYAMMKTEPLARCRRLKCTPAFQKQQLKIWNQLST